MVGIVALLLARRAEDAAKDGLGIGSHRRNHCQLPLLFASSPSISSRMKCRSPQRQSIPRSLVRKEPTTSRARLHPTLASELAHARVDERVAGPPCAPGVESLLGVTPGDPAAEAIPNSEGALRGKWAST